MAAHAVTEDPISMRFLLAPAPLAVMAALTIAVPAQAATKSYSLVKGMTVGRGLATAPDGSAWVATNSLKGKTPLLHVSPSGHITSLKVPVPTGLDFTGVGFGL